MSRKTEAISDELKLTLTTARMLHDHLGSIGKGSKVAELTAALKPFEETEAKMEEQAYG